MMLRVEVVLNRPLRAECPGWREFSIYFGGLLTEGSEPSHLKILAEGFQFGELLNVA